MSGQQPDYSPTEAGLPSAGEYDPTANYDVDITAGEPVQTWDEYGLALLPVLHDGQDVGRRHVVRNGDFVASVTDRYKLLPNEQAVAAANEAARELGAEPFHEFSGDWYAQLDDHVYQDQERRRVHALYAWDEPADLGDDKVQFGFAIHNSIDASLSFQVGLFSFRHACANMVTMTVKDVQADTFDTGRFDARNVEEEREVLQHSSRKHTSEFEIDKEALRHRIKLTLMPADYVADSYREWKHTEVSVGVVDTLLERATGSGSLAMADLPEWVQRLNGALSDAAENEDLETGEDLTDERRRDIIGSEIPADETLWDTYNDVTANVWHSDSTGDLTRDRKFRDLHRAAPPAPGVQ